MSRRPGLWLNPRWLLACLCLAAIVQGMIFTNVVISSIERRFGLHSTQSGVIAGKIRGLVQSLKKVFVRGLVNFVPAVAYLFCLNLPEAFSQPRTKTFSGSVYYVGK